MSRLCVCREYEDMFTEGYRYVESLEEHDAKVRADAIDECIAEINKQFKDGYGFGVTVYPHTICNILEMLKEKKNE